MTIYLPRAREILQKTVGNDSDLVFGSNEKILVIEDDFDVLTATAGLLEKLGYNVCKASTAVDALDALKTYPDIELIICDVILPQGKLGPEFIQDLPGKYRDIKVIFMSGFTDSLLEAGHWKQSQYFVLQKPFSVSALAKAITKVLDTAGDAANK